MFFWVSCFGLFLVPRFTAHMVGMMPIDLVFPVTPAAIGSHELYAQLLLVDRLYPPAPGLFFEPAAA
jgi:hypothetical protein